MSGMCIDLLILISLFHCILYLDVVFVHTITRLIVIVAAL